LFDNNKREEAEFLSPKEDFKKVTHPIEYRKDPLTGIRCRINIERTRRVKQARADVDMTEMAERARKTCFFCPENMERSTPKFSPDIVPEGRIIKGETRIFPNLFPFAKYHGVATLTTDHFQDLAEFKISQVEDTISASLDLFGRIADQDPTARFMSLSWNHLPSSGASIVHPHVQLIADPYPTNLTEVLLKKSQEYYEREGENYWKKLVEYEREAGERYIGRTGRVHCLASYAPLGNTEVMMVFDGISNLLELDENDVKEMAVGLKNVLLAYDSMGKKSFNLTTYSGPAGEDITENFSMSMRIISRPTPVTNYTSDSGFMESLHHERVVESMPEKVARPENWWHMALPRYCQR
jgi:galactose-1-phosphate uridylyltransferase